MFCENCGSKLVEEAQFCSNCGSKIGRIFCKNTKRENSRKSARYRGGVKC